jgi:hypothetical protein
MSTVTDAILVTQFEGPAINDTYSHKFVKLDTSIAGGNKVFCTNVYCCAVNYMDKEEILEAFKKAQWEAPETVELWLRYEHHDTFEQFTLNPEGLSPPSILIQRRREAAELYDWFREKGDSDEAGFWWERLAEADKEIERWTSGLKHFH